MALKIVQLLQKPQLRGAEIFACQLSEHLAKQGHEVLVVTIFNGDAELPFSGKVIHLDRPQSKRLYDINGWRNFSKILNDFKPDIIQANAADTLKFAVSSKFFFKWKTPIVFRNANKMGDFIDSSLKWQLNNFYISRTDFVISVSKECEKDFRRTFNHPKELIDTVEIGVESKKIGQVPEDLTDIFKKGPVLTHIGGFVPEKNHAGLLRIFGKIIQKFPQVQLLLIGKGRLQTEIKEETRNRGWEENIHFLNYRSDVLEILSHSQAFLLPSFIEGLPAVILEAMYCKTPVVAYNVGGIGEVVVSGSTGWLIKKNDESSFQESIEEVLTEDSAVLRMTSQAREIIEGKFMNGKIAERFSAVYENIISNKNVSPGMGERKGQKMQS